MRTLSNPRIGSASTALAIEAPFAARFEISDSRKKMDFRWVALAVLGSQLLIRAMLLMRQLNY